MRQVTFPGSGIRFEIRTAWRELHASWRRFIFAGMAVAIGVGALTGVKGFAEALQSALLKQSRDLLAADFRVRGSSRLTREEEETLAKLERWGADRTQLVETLSMASGDDLESPPLLVTVKAVDPNRYPFYGEVALDPAQPLGEALAPGKLVVSEDFLQRLGLKIGNGVRLGVSRFRITAALKQEPDRLASGIGFGPRILLSHESLDQTELVQRGSRVSRSFLFRIRTPSYDLDGAHTLVQSLTTGRLRMIDYRRPNPNLDRGLERMSTFLSLVSLISLLVGALGVAMSMHAYLQQKLDSIAIMKMLGGQSMQILRMYLYQGLVIAIVGSCVGVMMGYGVQLFFPKFVAGLIDLPAELHWAPVAAIQGFSVGVVATGLLILPPLLAVRRVRPSQVLRRNMMEESLFRPLRRHSGWGWVILSTLGLVIALGGIAAWLGGSWQRGFGFLAALAAAMILLLVFARALVKLIPRLPQSRSLAWRHGLANLGRPGSQSTAVFVALGIGVMLTASVYLLESSLLKQLVRSAPEDFPNLVLIGIPEQDKKPLWQFLESRPGIIDAGVPVPALPGRLRRVNGVALEEYNRNRAESAPDAKRERNRRSRRFARGEFQLTWAERLPPDAGILEGRWWDGRPSEPQVSVAEFFAGSLGLHPGDLLEFSSGGRYFKARVANIREVLFVRPGSNNAFIFSPGTLDGFPASYVANVRAKPDSVAEIQRILFQRFPTLTSIHVGEILATIQMILDRISLVIQYVAVFAILAGCIILASAVASTRQRRIRESVLLKTLGATRALVARIQSVEFLILGLAAGTIGSLAANVLASYLLGELLDTQYEFRWEPVLISALTTALLAVMTGRVAGRGILNQKPLQVLREE